MGNERPQDSASDLLDTILRILGGGTSSAGGNHSIASIDTTYRQLTDGTSPALVSDPTSDQKFIVRVFLNNMASGDTLDIRIDVESADGTFESTNYNFSGAQTNQEWQDYEFELFNGFGGRVFIRQTAGTARTVPYRVIAGQALA